ncbi:MAG: hypothetical protein AAB863_02105 [Patescibacteria group bacterium]
MKIAKLNLKNSCLPSGRENSTRGFSLFISVIVMGSLLLIAFSVANISVKETEFSTSNRESQYAIFAADAGVECALYWDAKHPSELSAFATSTSGSPISCAGVLIGNGQTIPGTTTAVLIGGGGSGNPTSAIYFPMNIGSNPTNACVIVTITKNQNGSTYISSYGYNQCANPSDPRRVERGIEVTY